MRFLSFPNMSLYFLFNSFPAISVESLPKFNNNTICFLSKKYSNQASNQFSKAYPTSLKKGQGKGYWISGSIFGEPVFALIIAFRFISSHFLTAPVFQSCFSVHFFSCRFLAFLSFHPISFHSSWNTVQAHSQTRQQQNVNDTEWNWNDMEIWNQFQPKWLHTKGKGTQRGTKRRKGNERKLKELSKQKQSNPVVPFENPYKTNN